MMLRVGILSDCHLESESLLEQIYAMLPEPGTVDVFLLPGDATRGQLAYRLCVMINEHLGCPVLYTPGNHEFYYTHGLHCTLAEMEADCRIQFSAHPEVHYLQGDSITIGDVSFFGSTWWTNFRGLGAEYMSEAMAVSDLVADFRYINIKSMTPAEVAEKVNKLNRQSGVMRGQAYYQNSGQSFHHKITAQDMIDMNLEAARRYREWYVSTPGKKVLQAHFPMLKELQHSSYPPNPYFVSADDLFLQQFPPNLLVFAHTHCNFRKTASGIPCVSNQYGYKTEQTWYDPGFVVEI